MKSSVTAFIHAPHAAPPCSPSPARSPAPVLAALVGISTGKAAAWAKLAARDWSDYVANRAASR